MRIRREIGKKGQVVIPKDIRELLGLKEGSSIVFEIEGEEIKLKNGEDPEKWVENFLNISGKEKKGSTKEIKKIIDERYDE